MSTDFFTGFIAVNFQIGTENVANRQLFVKQHDGEDEVKPSDRTLFILNVPQHINEKCIKYLYQDCGDIERIYFHSKPKSKAEKIDEITSFSTPELSIGFKVAYIVFKDPSGLKKALKCKELPPIRMNKVISSIGLKKWIKEYNSSFIDTRNVQNEIETYMSNYDKKIEEEKRKAKEIDSVEDEEGWITITKHSKKPKISRNEKVSKKLIEKQNRDTARKSLLNFYRCQLRESKMEHILEMRKKTEKDKERIAQMKANRKFKPF